MRCFAEAVSSNRLKDYEDWFPLEPGAIFPVLELLVLR